MKSPHAEPTFRPGLVTIVMPARNEADAIGATLRSLPRATLRAMGFEVEVLILDGRSSDRTREIAYEHGDTTVVFERRDGKGRAFTDGREHFRGDYVVMLDADATYAGDAIPRVLGPLAWGEADVVMGDRKPQEGSMTGFHSVGASMLSSMASILYMKPCRDVCTGLWGFRADSLAQLPLRSHRFELEAEMFSLAVRQGLRIAHVPVDYLPRKGSPKLTAFDALRIGWCLMRSRVVPLQYGEHEAQSQGHERSAASEEALS